MISKNRIKFISSLSTKKARNQNGLFIIEGTKLVLELLDSDFDVEYIVAYESWFSENRTSPEIETIETNEQGMKKISNLTTPSDVLAVAKIPDINIDEFSCASELVLVLDDIRNPGNLGTIIRIADWFGIKQIICSNETVDVYNPKVVQATMGAIFRTKLYYCHLADFFSIQQKQHSIPVYGTFMEGESIYTKQLPNSAYIIMGNEGIGISSEIEKHISQKISIPSFSDGKGSESLNVAIATSIILSEFKRQSL